MPTTHLEDKGQHHDHGMNNWPMCVCARQTALGCLVRMDSGQETYITGCASCSTCSQPFSSHGYPKCCVPQQLPQASWERCQRLCCHLVHTLQARNEELSCIPPTSSRNTWADMQQEQHVAAIGPWAVLCAGETTKAKPRHKGMEQQLAANKALHQSPPVDTATCTRTQMTVAAASGPVSALQRCRPTCKSKCNTPYGSPVHGVTVAARCRMALRGPARSTFHGINEQRRRDTRSTDRLARFKPTGLLCHVTALAQPPQPARQATARPQAQELLACTAVKQSVQVY